MASNLQLLLPFSLSCAIVQVSTAGDPDILTDFIAPPVTGFPIDGNYFTFTGMRKLVGAPFPTTFKVLKATMGEFPPLFLMLYSSSLQTRLTHYMHPRASELLFCLMGTLEVGFVDTTNKLFTQKLQAGDIFVFPKELAHFQFNSDAKYPAMALSAFGSAMPGLVSVPYSVFNTSINYEVLAKSFKTDVAPIQKIKSGLSG